MTAPTSDRLDELMAEIASVLDFQAGGGSGYEASADAMWKAPLAVFNYVAHEVGATGFQASWAAIKLYAEAMNVECPMTVVRLEDALYPQYDLPGRLEKFMDEHRDWLSERAEEKLAGDLSFVHPDVLAHWRKLAQPAPTEVS